MTDAERAEVQQMIRTAIPMERRMQVDELRALVGQLRTRADDTQAQPALHRADVTGAFILDSYADALAHRTADGYAVRGCHGRRVGRAVGIAQCHRMGIAARRGTDRASHRARGVTGTERVTLGFLRRVRRAGGATWSSSCMLPY